MNTNPKKLQIALVSDAIYPYNVGGKEKRIYEVSTRLAQKGHQVTIYTMKWWQGEEMSRVENGVTLKAISPLYPLYSGKRRSMKEAFLFALHCFKLLKEDFDLIDVDHMPHLVLFPLKIVSVLKRKKLFVTWNEVWGRKYWVEYLGVLGNVAYILERLGCMVPDIIISVSQHTTAKLRKNLGGKKDIITIPNGIDIEKLAQIKPAKETSDVIYAGRLLEHKNVDTLIEAIAVMKEKKSTITCLIIGNGPEEKRLQNLVNKLNLQKNVLFYSFLPNHEDLYSLIKSSKVFVMPSSREGFGIAALEAHALGIPVVTYDHKDNATTDLIQEGKNGYLFSDKQTLSLKIAKLLEKPLDSREIMKSARTYDWKNITDKIEEAYQ